MPLCLEKALSFCLKEDSEYTLYFDKYAHRHQPKITYAR